MADKILKGKRKKFVHSVGTGTLNGLLDELLQKQVLNQEEMQIIKYQCVTIMEKARALVDGIIHKGPQACQICIDVVCEEDYYLARTLGLFSASQEVQDNQLMPMSSGRGGGLKLCTLEMAQNIWRENSAEIYPIMNQLTRTRLALIICNTEFDSLPKRTGAEADIRNMKTLLEGLGYQVIVRENLTALEMATEVKAFAANPQHKTSDSTFLVFMSHGILDGICGKKHSAEENDVLQMSNIFAMLNTSNCSSLKDKPKVIIIQACLVEKKSTECVKDEAGDPSNIFLTPEGLEFDGIMRVHIEKDFIAFCSSTPDDFSLRPPENGSLFITKLTEIMQEYACCCDLQEIFQKVQLALDTSEPMAQTPVKERVTLTKHFYLFPGH
ncbi:caspase-1-like [Octodon degus]|uniref:Caspase-1 n=1 Tax=Octodon degus TaxID=10160 RepID=A0A6P6DZK2_OCTDE|nr:caspase-1-like [Octodon degus]